MNDEYCSLTTAATATKARGVDLVDDDGWPAGSVRCSASGGKYARQGSNLRPPGSKPGALSG